MNLTLLTKLAVRLVYNFSRFTRTVYKIKFI